MHVRYIVVVLIISVLSSCESSIRFSLPTETVKPVAIATFTVVPIMSPPGSVTTLSITPTTNPNLGTPLPDWEGIPVIPDATKGEIKAFGYMYWVNVSVDEVETFYMEQMKGNGWPLVKHTNVLSWYGRGKLLQFKQDHNNEVVDVTFVADTRDHSVMVAIKKYVYNP